MGSPTEDSLAIGKIQKTHGRHGEVAVDILTDFPDRFDPGSVLQLSDGLENEERTVEASRFHKRRLILKFADCDSISAAEKLVGRWIVIPREARRPLPPGVVYLADLIGCAVREGEETLGVVEGLEDTGAPILLRIRMVQGGELLVPFAAEICRNVDVERREIRVELPEGLRELNQADKNLAGSERQREMSRSRRTGNRQNR